MLLSCAASLGLSSRMLRTQRHRRPRNALSYKDDVFAAVFLLLPSCVAKIINPSPYYPFRGDSTRHRECCATISFVPGGTGFVFWPLLPSHEWLGYGLGSQTRNFAFGVPLSPCGLGTMVLFGVLLHWTMLSSRWARMALALATLLPLGPSQFTSTSRWSISSTFLQATRTVAWFLLPM